MHKRKNWKLPAAVAATALLCWVGLAWSAWTTPKTWVANNVFTAAELNTYLRDNLNILKTSINDSGYLSVVDSTEVTIASGVITVTQNFHTVDTESDAASDNLDTITAGTSVVAGHILVLQAEHNARSVVLNRGSSTLELNVSGDMTLDHTDDSITLIYDGTNWTELARSDNNT